MKASKIFALILTAAFALQSQAVAQMQVENLNRGLIAVRVGQGYYLSWRLLANEPFSTGFNVYHGTTQLNSTPITGATIYTDATRAQMTPANSAYTVRAVINGVEQAASEPAMIINNTQGSNAGYHQINLQRPATGEHGGTYAPGDASVGDLDGDGVYEIILKWDPSNQRDNSQDGTTDNVLIDAYKLDGTRMWRIDLGQNIRAGAHYTQFLVYDFDGDGRAEMIVKTAPGTRDATGNHIRKGPAATANHNTSHRNAGGHITAGPEFLTVFNGLTGNEDTTITYLPARDPVSGWGGAGRDNGGNRSQRFNAAVAYLDGERPSAVFNRGYYERMALWALDWRNGRLTERWMFDSQTSGNGNYAGQGNHQLSVADVNNSGRHSIITGSAVIGSDGRGMHTSRLGHGDALHVAHMIKGTATPQIFMPHESGSVGVSLRQANNGTMIFSVDNSNDVGRGVAAELDPARPGFKFWGARSMGLYNIDATIASSTLPSSNNHIIWWDGDLARELLDGNTVTKWSIANNRGTSLLSASGYSSINGSKSNPVLQADIFGDWREEVIFSNGSNAIRIYTTTMTTTHRLVTMMHDPTYRVAVAWQNSSYNQPPHPGYYIASDMDAGFPLDVVVIGGSTTPPPPPPPQCTQGVDCDGDPCPEGQIGLRPNCENPPPPAYVTIPGGEYIGAFRLYDPSAQVNWSVQSGLEASTEEAPTEAFGDRQHMITAVPDALRGTEWIRPAMNSRTFTTSTAHHADTLISFEMLRDGIVYVAYENRVETKPSWLAARGFALVSGISLTVTENGGAERTFDIYSKEFAQGETVTTGINSNDGTTLSMIYLVAAGPVVQLSIRAPSLQATRNAMTITRSGRGAFMVDYAITRGGNVRLDVYDMRGRRVRTIVNAAHSAGVYRERIETNSLRAGTYLLRLNAGQTVMTERFTVAR